MEQKKRSNNMEEISRIAPGIDDDEELNMEASTQEIQQGDSTRVFTFSYDEVDPS